MQERNTTNSPGAMAYTFQHPPQGFLHPQYRDPAVPSASATTTTSMGRKQYANIMHDRRVYRGSTYAATPVSTHTKEEEARKEREILRRKKEMAQRAASIKRRKELDEARRRLATPPPVVGRQHIDVQTEEFLEELKDEMEVVQQETQTDPMLDRPATPKYVPMKSGRDAETQIHERDLFHFDDAVDPILDVMVGKTMEQAMLEVLQEEEMELLRQQQLEFEQRRKEELLEAQRLEAREKRLFEEKERRKKQEVERIQREKETREKLQARQFAKVYLLNLENRVFARLQDEGWFQDRVVHEVEFDFFPWLMEEVKVELEKKQRARLLVDDLIRQVVAMQLEE
ncbi:Radial spoke 3 [Trypanosoma melophagium]|uniref:Radial spoke 3 n=1 Tax=Trypanosoma melophagium TaxID=715481 RepID=UPI003519FC18|nr:Radial spoke 3 [Trypanosoma melophagium]